MTAWAALLHAPLVERLGWVLIHFLWEGAAIALLLAAVLRLSARTSSHVRYAGILGAFALCAASPVVTWAVLDFGAAPVPATSSELGTPLSADVAAPALPRTLAVQGDVAPVQAVPTESAWPDQVSRAVQTATPYVVGVWLAGVFVLTLRLTMGWAGMRRVYLSGVPIRDAFYLDRFRVLLDRMQIGLPVRLLESARVEIPMLIGWLRPVILVPTSVFAGLSPDQLEAILAHELAHVRRYDYLVNLLQTVIETVLFYHPAIWWIGRKLREERENCCDDIALEVMQDRLVYIRALARLEEGRAVPLTMSAAGGSLLQRIKRIVGANERKASAWPLWILITTGFFIICLTHSRSAASATGAAILNSRSPQLTQTDAPRDLSTGEKDLLTAKEDADARKVLVNSLKDLPDDQFVATIAALGRSNPAIANLQGSIDAKVAEIQGLLKDGSSEDHPRVQTLRAEVASLREQEKPLVAGVRRALDIDRESADLRVVELTKQMSGATPLPPPTAVMVEPRPADTDQRLDDLQHKLQQAQEDANARRVLMNSVQNLPDDKFLATMAGLGRSDPTSEALQKNLGEKEAAVAGFLRSGLGENDPRVAAARAELGGLQENLKRLTDGQRKAMTIDIQMADSRVALIRKEVENSKAETSPPAAPLNDHTVHGRLVVPKDARIDFSASKGALMSTAQTPDHNYWFDLQADGTFTVPHVANGTYNPVVQLVSAANNPSKGSLPIASYLEPITLDASSKDLTLVANLGGMFKDVPKASSIQIGLKFIEMDEDLYTENKARIDAAVEQADIGYFNNLKGVDMLSAPSVTTRPGLKATIDVVREFPYPISFEDAEAVSRGEFNGANQVALIPPTPREFVTKDVGVSAEITPTIDASRSAYRGKIVLNGKISLSWLDGFTKSNVTGVNMPTFDTHESLFMEALDDGQEKGMWIPGGRFDVEIITDKDPAGKIVSKTEKSAEKRLLVFVSAKLIR